MIDEMHALHSNGTFELVSIMDNKSIVWYWLLYTNLWTRLYWHFLSCCQNDICLSSLLNYSYSSLFSTNLRTRLSLFMVVLMRKSIWSNLLDLLLRGSCFIWCHLCRSLYGLNQSLCAWFGWFRIVTHLFGIIQIDADHSLFFRNFP